MCMPTPTSSQQMVQGWADGTDKTRGVYLIATEEGSNYSWKRFYSRDYYDSGKRPKIEYTYNTYPNTPTTLTADDGEVGTPVNLATVANTELDGDTVAVSATVSDPDGGKVRALFDIYETFPGSSTQYLVASQVPGL